MNALTHLAPTGTAPGDGDIFDTIVNALYQYGYSILPSALPPNLVDSLFIDFKSIDKQQFKNAGIGREQDHQANPFVRSDAIYWLDEERAAARAYFQWMEQLRQRINRRLFLGLFDYECHYAYFGSGNFYKKHVDAFRGQRNRVVTSVLYLNPNWAASDGGELLLYDSQDEKLLATVPPYYGSLVVFLSEDFPHEVCVARKPRYSLTGWFRLNNSIGGMLDPAV